ncbi:MAG: flagellar hook protein [Lachnospiraceae bacterium]|nr:flagellar hook protein [Lachnospiraceae bacterium]
MVVQHNLSAMNANRMLGITQGTLSKSTEKLSSGYKVNRAADDAAGLSISEKMRKQIRGLTQASLNAEDGISAVQTAEGALAEVHDMLQRMNELAVKASNGTNSESDRSSIQDEINQLVTEIDRVAETTKFNETYLLKGDSKLAKGYSLSYIKATDTKAKAAVTMGTDTATGMTAGITFEDGSIKLTNDEMNELVKSLKTQGLTITTSADSAGTLKTSISLNGDAATDFSVVCTADDKFEIQDAEGNKMATVSATVGSIAGTVTVLATDATAQASDKELAVYYDKDGNAVSANGLDDYFSVGEDGKAYLNADAGQLYDAVGKKLDMTKVAKDITQAKDQVAALNIKFQVGADTSRANKISVNIESMSAKGLGITGLKVDGASSTNADNAVNTIESAIAKVSAQRSALGAVQNRLEHTINNLDNVVENTTAAESQIRDTDMASEMVKYSNANILSQAGQSMLAQANQSNQGVLSLLG